MEMPFFIYSNQVFYRGSENFEHLELLLLYGGFNYCQFVVKCCIKAPINTIWCFLRGLKAPNTAIWCNFSCLEAPTTTIWCYFLEKLVQLLSFGAFFWKSRSNSQHLVSKYFFEVPRFNKLMIIFSHLTLHPFGFRTQNYQLYETNLLFFDLPFSFCKNFC